MFWHFSNNWTFRTMCQRQVKQAEMGTNGDIDERIPEIPKREYPEETEKEHKHRSRKKSCCHFLFLKLAQTRSLACLSKAKVLNTKLGCFSSRWNTGKPWRWEKQTKLKSGMRSSDMGVGSQYPWNFFASLNYVPHSSRTSKFSKQDGKESD